MTPTLTCLQQEARFRPSARMAGVLCLLLAAALWLWTPPLQAEDTGNSAVVIMYHRFGEDQYPTTSVRLEQFEAHLAELRKPKYHVLPVPEIVAALQEGRPLPDHAIGISIDDAYRSVYTEAWPRLRAAGFPFTVFTATDPLDKGYESMMSWAQLRELTDSGLVSVGNHTASHLHMADHDPQRLRQDIRKATERIKAELGIVPHLFAYPYGEYSLEVRQVVGEEAFRAAFGQQSGAIGRGTDAYDMPRFALNEHYGEQSRFELVINTLPLPVEDVEPRELMLSKATNPPRLTFTVADRAGSLNRLTCYATGQGRLEVQSLGARRVAVQPPKAFAVGRSRINCTLPGPDGRWRWYGTQYYLPGS